MSDAEWRGQTWQNIQRFAEASDETQLAEEEAEDLLWHVHDRLGLKDVFEDYWQRLPEQEAWAIGLIRQLARVLAEQCGNGFDEFLQNMKNTA